MGSWIAKPFRWWRKTLASVKGAEIDILDQYVLKAPSAQTALDIFEGEWSSKLPGEWAGLRAGALPLFEDPRILWALDVFNGVEGRSVLELGPLEAGHTYLLERHGAASVLAVEANTRAYLKCLVAKEVLGLSRSRFLCGDFVEFLRGNRRRFDVCFASGVLYHMRNPAELIALLGTASDRLFLWTHYYDADIVSRSPALRGKFTGSTSAAHQGFRHIQYRYEYQQALDSKGFCGGSAPFSHWLSREQLLQCLEHFGWGEIHIHLEDRQHPNGPCFCLATRRTCQRQTGAPVTALP